MMIEPKRSLNKWVEEGYVHVDVANVIRFMRRFRDAYASVRDRVFDRIMERIPRRTITFPLVNQYSIDYSTFDSVNLRENLGIRSNSTVTLYLSTIIKRMGLDILIRAVKRMEQQGKEIFL